MEVLTINPSVIDPRIAEIAELATTLEKAHVIHDKKVGIVFFHLIPSAKNISPGELKRLVNIYRTTILNARTSDPTKKSPVKIIRIRSWIKLNLLYDMIFTNYCTPHSKIKIRGFQSINVKFKSSMREKQFMQQLHRNFNEALYDFDKRLDELEYDIRRYKYAVSVYRQSITSPMAYLYITRKLRCSVMLKNSMQSVLIAKSSSIEFWITLSLFCLTYQAHCLKQTFAEFQQVLRHSPVLRYECLLSTQSPCFYITRSRLQHIVETSQRWEGRELVLEESVVPLLRLFLRAQHCATVVETSQRPLNFAEKVLLQELIGTTVPSLFCSPLTVRVRCNCVFQMFAFTSRMY